MASISFKRRAVRCTAVCALLGGVLAGCNRGTLHDSQGYCDYLNAHLSEFVKVPATRTDLDAKVGLINTLAAKAPVAVDDQWRQIAALVKEAATVNVNDPVADQKLTADSYSAERAMREISAHAGAICGLVLPAVGSVTPSATLPPPPTTKARAVAPTRATRPSTSAPATTAGTSASTDGADAQTVAAPPTT